LGYAKQHLEQQLGRSVVAMLGHSKGATDVLIYAGWYAQQVCCTFAVHANAARCTAGQGRAAQTSFFRADSAHEPAALKIQIRLLQYMPHAATELRVGLCGWKCSSCCSNTQGRPVMTHATLLSLPLPLLLPLLLQPVRVYGSLALCRAQSTLLHGWTCVRVWCDGWGSKC
jgi:triacylglycerol esterase/lipase EstA (alpha/beta hydrolase family)